MNEQFDRPKSFGEILDHSFRLSKNKFPDLFKILLLLLGPVYLIQAIVQLLSGMSFIRQDGNGDAWYEQFMGSMEGTTAAMNPGADLILLVIGLATFLLYPIAQAAIIFTIDHIRKNESYTVGSVIKKAFSRFLPIIGSSLLFGLIVFGTIVISIVVLGMVTLAGGAADIVTSIVLGAVLLLALFVGAALLLTRLSFYLAAVVLDGDTPGLSTSWRLTKHRTWKLFGLYVVFYLIIGAISAAVEALLGIFLGNSVLFMLLINLVTLFTMIILSVGYTVMYMDLKIRHSADDLKEMIHTYNKEKQ